MNNINKRDISIYLSYDSEIKRKFDYSSYLKFLKKNHKSLGLFGKYMPNHLHDSEVIKIIQKKGVFKITLNDLNFVILASELIKKFNLKINHKKLIFPVEIIFLESDVNFYKILNDGNLKKIKESNFDEYLYEKILRIEKNLIEIEMVFWKHTKIRGNEIFLHLIAKSIDVIEKQEKQWNLIFGDKYIKVFEYYQKEFKKGRYLTDISESIKLINEVI